MPITWNPSDINSTLALSNGNLTVAKGSSGNGGVVRATSPIAAGAKVYWEITMRGDANTGTLGIASSDVPVASRYLENGYTSGLGKFRSYAGYAGTKSRDGVSAAAYGTDLTTNDILGIAVDRVNGTITFYKNGVSYGIAFSDLSDMSEMYAAASIDTVAGALDVYEANFGGKFFTYDIPTGYSAYDSSGIYSRIKTNLSSMSVGDMITCEYTAASGAVGTFANIGSASKSFIPVGSSATPNGKFYFLCVGEDWKGRKKLVADRNIQHSVSWDALNTAGIVSGVSLIDTKTQTFAIPSGSAYMDTATKASAVGVSGETITGCKDSAGIRSILGRSSGKWYWEVTYNGGGRGHIGICSATHPLTTQAYYSAEHRAWDNYGWVYPEEAVKLGDGSPYTTGNIIGVALDLDNGTLSFYKNGTFVGVSHTNVKLLGTVYALLSGTDGVSTGYRINLGGSAFTYTPPSGFVAYSASSVVSNPTYSPDLDLTFRLMTGGISSASKENEWDKIIVESTLGGIITAGDNAVWNWSGMYGMVSTRATSTDINNRGYATVSDHTTGGDTNLANTARGFRPILIAEVLNATPTSSDMSVDKTSITTDSVTLTGTISDSDVGQQVQYRILINAVQYADWTSLANPPVSISSVIAASNFASGSNTITVEFKDSLGASGTTWTSPTISKLNSGPTISSNTLASTTHNSNVTLAATLTDAEGDTIQYRIKLNGSSYYPDGSNSWTTLASSPVSISRSIPVGDLSWGSNTVSLEFKDSLGNGGTTWSPEVTKTNAAPTDTLGVSATSVHNSNITLSGSLSDSDGDTIQYRIMLDGSEHVTWSSLAASPVSVNHVFTPSDLSFGDHTIAVEYKDQYELSGTTFSQIVSRTNATPTNDLVVDRTTRHRDTVRLTGNLYDADGDTLQYRISLGGSVIDDWSTLAGTGTVAIDRTFTANELGTSSKTILVEYRDQFGQLGVDYSQLITFTNDTPVVDVDISNPTTTDTTGIFADNITLIGNLTEPDGDTVRYRITINGVEVKAWSNYLTAPAAISETYGPSDFSVLGNNTIVLYIEDDLGASASRTYTVRKRDWELTYISSDNTTTKYIGDTKVRISPTETLLIRTGTIDEAKGYLKQAILSLNMLTQGTGTVKMAQISGEWDVDSVTYANKPIINTAGAIDITFTNTAYQSIDVTEFAGSYGVALYTTTGTFDINPIGNSSSIQYYPTTMIQPYNVLADGVTLNWTPVVFGNLNSESFSWLVVYRSESNTFSPSSVVYQSNDPQVLSCLDDTVEISKTYYYKVQLQFNGYPNVDSDVIYVNTPDDTLHRMVWNDVSYVSAIVEGLMFHDSIPEFYSTNKGLILKYLSIPLLYAGQSSEPAMVQIDNTFDSTATDVTITSDMTNMPYGTYIKFSLEATPFEDLDSLILSSMPSQSNQVFYVKLYTHQYAQGQGTFDIRVKGTLPL